ncbi:MAG: ankyrin repeat domain-containing protein, partial [Myxococcota bacterium]
MWDQIYLGIGVVVVGMIVALLLLRILDRLRGRAGQGEAALPPLIAVVIAGDREAMTKQLAAGEDIGQRDEHQRTALHHAVMQNDRVLVEILLDHDIAIDAAD